MMPHIATDRRANLLGAAWMVAAMAVFAIEDVFIKAASVSIPLGQVLIVFGLGGTLLFAVLAKMRGESLFTRDVLSRPMWIRAIFECFGRLFYGLALALTPLSATTVILQATPLVVVAGAALIFDEKVGWRRWAAILIGLTGVLVILQPGAEGFSALSILAVLGMLGFAGRDLASRAAPRSLSAPVLGFYGFVPVALAGAAYGIWEGRAFVLPDGQAGLFLCGAVLAGVLAYGSLMTAMRMGEVSAVTPFRYTRLLFGIGFGVVLFGETISPTMLVGSGLIVLSGLFILWRSRQKNASR